MNFYSIIAQHQAAGANPVEAPEEGVDETGELTEKVKLGYEMVRNFSAEVDRAVEWDSAEAINQDYERFKQQLIEHGDVSLFDLLNAEAVRGCEALLDVKIEAVQEHLDGLADIDETTEEGQRALDRLLNDPQFERVDELENILGLMVTFKGDITKHKPQVETLKQRQVLLHAQRIFVPYCNSAMEENRMLRPMMVESLMLRLQRVGQEPSKRIKMARSVKHSATAVRDWAGQALERWGVKDKLSGLWGRMRPDKALAEIKNRTIISTVGEYASKIDRIISPEAAVVGQLRDALAPGLEDSAQKILLHLRTKFETRERSIQTFDNVEFQDYCLQLIEALNLLGVDTHDLEKEFERVGIPLVKEWALEAARVYEFKPEPTEVESSEVDPEALDDAEDDDAAPEGDEDEPVVELKHYIWTDRGPNQAIGNYCRQVQISRWPVAGINLPELENLQVLLRRRNALPATEQQALGEMMLEKIELRLEEIDHLANRIARRDGQADELEKAFDVGLYSLNGFVQAAWQQGAEVDTDEIASHLELWKGSLDASKIVTANQGLLQFLAGLCAGLNHEDVWEEDLEALQTAAEAITDPTKEHLAEAKQGLDDAARLVKSAEAYEQEYVKKSVEKLKALQKVLKGKPLKVDWLSDVPVMVAPEVAKAKPEEGEIAEPERWKEVVAAALKAAESKKNTTTQVLRAMEEVRAMVQDEDANMLLAEEKPLPAITKAVGESIKTIDGLAKKLDKWEKQPEDKRARIDVTDLADEVERLFLPELGEVVAENPEDFPKLEPLLTAQQELAKKLACKRRHSFTEPEVKALGTTLKKLKSDITGVKGQVSFKNQVTLARQRVMQNRLEEALFGADQPFVYAIKQIDEAQAALNLEGIGFEEEEEQTAVLAQLDTLKQACEKRQAQIKPTEETWLSRSAVGRFAKVINARVQGLREEETDRNQITVPLKKMASRLGARNHEALRDERAHALLMRDKHRFSEALKETKSAWQGSDEVVVRFKGRVERLAHRLVNPPPRRKSKTAAAEANVVDMWQGLTPRISDYRLSRFRAGQELREKFQPTGGGHGSSEKE